MIYMPCLRVSYFEVNASQLVKRTEAQLIAIQPTAKYPAAESGTALKQLTGR